MLDKINNELRRKLDLYFRRSRGCLRGAEVTDAQRRRRSRSSKAATWVGRAAHETHDGDNKIMFVGNGGSAGIASHLAIDFSKNGDLRSMAFNDARRLPASATILATRMSLPSRSSSTPVPAIS